MEPTLPQSLTKQMKYIKGQEIEFKQDDGSWAKDKFKGQLENDIVIINFGGKDIKILSINLAVVKCKNVDLSSEDREKIEIKIRKLKKKIRTERKHLQTTHDEHLKMVNARAKLISDFKTANKEKFRSIKKTFTNKIDKIKTTQHDVLANHKDPIIREFYNKYNSIEKHKDIVIPTTLDIITVDPHETGSIRQIGREGVKRIEKYDNQIKNLRSQLAFNVHGIDEIYVRYESEVEETQETQEQTVTPTVSSSVLQQLISDVVHTVTDVTTTVATTAATTL